MRRWKKWCKVSDTDHLKSTNSSLHSELDKDMEERSSRPEKLLVFSDKKLVTSL